MISWRVCVVFMVAFYLEAVLSCTYDYECDGYDETCCEDGYCSSSCDTSGVSAVLVVIIVIVVGFKVLFWVAFCYFRYCRRKPRAVVVSHSTFEMMPPGYVYPPREGYLPPPREGYPPPPQEGYPPQAYSPP